MKLLEILKEEWMQDMDSSFKLEESYFEINELKIDDLNSYQYKKSEFLPDLGFSESWEFEDRCGNTLVAVYLKSIKEFKSGFKIPGVDTLVFDLKTNPQALEFIYPCADDKRVNTIYKILITEVIPNYLLDKKPNKLIFNPVSNSRSRLVDILLNKAIQRFPQLKKNNNLLVHI